jgi:hypothetical protein
MEHLTQVSMPRGSVTYDLLGSKTDAVGNRTVYTYDAYYRVTMEKKYPAALGGSVEDVCQRVTYTYDAYTDVSAGFYGSGQW